MKTSNRVLACLVLMTSVGMAHAQSASQNTYFEVGLGATSIKDGAFNITPITGQTTLGHNFHENLAIEGSLIFTVSERTEQNKAVDNNNKTEVGFGVAGLAVYLKPQLNLSKNTQVFARLGVSSIEGTGRQGQSTIFSDSHSSFSYGVGIQTAITKRIYGQLSYTLLSKKEEITFQTSGVSLGYRF